MSADYNNAPAFLREALEDWFEANKRERAFWQRVVYWLDMRSMGFRPTWESTRWAYPTLHGISTTSYPKWDIITPATDRRCPPNMVYGVQRPSDGTPCS